MRVKKISRRAQRVASTEFLIGVTTALFLFSLAPQVPIYNRFSRFEVAAVALAALLAVLVLKRPQIKVFVIPIPIAVLLVIMLVSIAQFPAFFVFKDYLTYVGIAVFAVVAMNFANPQTIINAVAIAGLMMGLLTVYYFVFKTGQSFDETGFRGSFTWSNNMPISLMFAVPSLTVARFRSRLVTHTFRFFSLSFIFVLIFYSTARSALVAFIVTMLAWLFFWLWRSKRKLAIVIFISYCALGLLLAVNWVSVTGFLGKSADLSGRFSLWAAYIEAIAERPLTGYGWHLETRIDMPLGQEIFQSFGLVLINANNDILNWWALTGVFGALSIALSVGLLILLGVSFSTQLKDSQWYFLSGIAFIAGGIAELSTMHPDGWLMLVFVWTALSSAFRPTNRAVTVRSALYESLLRFIILPSRSSSKTQ